MHQCVYFFFFNDTATTEIYTLSLHDALPIFGGGLGEEVGQVEQRGAAVDRLSREQVGAADELVDAAGAKGGERLAHRSEEHTSELQSRQYLVCRLLLEKKIKSRCILLMYCPC